MLKRNQAGLLGVTGLLLIVTVFLLVGALSFAVWAFAGRQDYKNNVGQKIAVAVAAAKQQEGAAKDQQYAEAQKQPLKTYSGPDAYGSLSISYPKTWSGYVDDSGNGQALVDGYFYPGVVPSITSQTSVFALRVQVLSQAYNQLVANLIVQQQAGKLSSVVYSLPKVPKVVGVEVSGSLPNNKSGTMVVLPLRDKTLEIWTEGGQFLSDFNSNILPHFSFSP